MLNEKLKIDREQTCAIQVGRTVITYILKNIESVKQERMRRVVNMGNQQAQMDQLKNSQQNLQNLSQMKPMEMSYTPMPPINFVSSNLNDALNQVNHNLNQMSQSLDQMAQMNPHFMRSAIEKPDGEQPEDQDDDQNEHNDP